MVNTSTKFNSIWIDRILLVILFAITFYPLIYTGYLTRDDAVRHLAVLSSGLFSELWGLAESSGRITLGAHIFLTHIAYLVDSTIYRKTLLILPHICVIFLFSFVLKSYIKSKTLSAVFVILFLAFFANSWEHNLYASYPFAFHVSIASILLSGYFLRKYLDDSRNSYLIFTGVFYCVAIFTYEQFLSYCIFFILLIWLRPKSETRPISSAFRASLLLVTLTVLNLIVVAVFRMYLPGTYEGTTIAAFDIVRFAKTIKVFIASAFPLYIPFKYVGRIEYTSITGGYSIEQLLQNVQYVSVLKAIIVSVLLVRTLNKSDYKPTSNQVMRHGATAGLLLILSVLMISLSEKYQHWVLNSGTLAYSSSSYAAQICSAAIVAICLSYALNRERSKSMHLVFYGFMIAGISYIVFVTEIHNASVLAGQKNSANKWLAIDSLYKSGELNAIPSGSIIYAPEFINTGGIASMQEGYWKIFLANKYKLDLNITADLYEVYSPSNANKRFEIIYNSSYPHSDYSVTLRHFKKGDNLIYIKDNEEDGFYAKEYGEKGRQFYWSKSASSVNICNGKEKNADVFFTGIVQTDGERVKPLTICAFDNCNYYRLSTTPVLFKVSFTIPPGCISVKFRTEAGAVNAPNDPRALYFQLSDFSVVENNSEK